MKINKINKKKETAYRDCKIISTDYYCQAYAPSGNRLDAISIHSKENNYKEIKNIIDSFWDGFNGDEELWGKKIELKNSLNCMSNIKRYIKKYRGFYMEILEGDSKDYYTYNRMNRHDAYYRVLKLDNLFNLWNSRFSNLEYSHIDPNYGVCKTIDEFFKSSKSRIDSFWDEYDGSTEKWMEKEKVEHKKTMEKIREIGERMLDDTFLAIRRNIFPAPLTLFLGLDGELPEQYFPMAAQIKGISVAKYRKLY